MSAEENKDVVRRYWEEVWNQKRLNMLEEFVAPVHTIHLPGGQAHRPPSIPVWVDQAMISFPDVHFTLEDMIAEGDRVATRWSYLATHTGPFLGIPPTGRQVTDSGTTTVRIEDGKIAEMWVNQDSLGLLQQLGVVRRPGPEGWGGTPSDSSGGSSSASLSAAENNAIAEHFFDSAWNRGDLSVLDELLTPDSMDYSTLHGEPEQGSTGFRQIITMFRAAFPDIHLTIDDEIYTGDKVAHRWTLRGTHQAPFMGATPTGKKIEFTGTTIVQMREGKIIARWSNLDLLRLMQQLGIVPPPPVG